MSRFFLPLLGCLVLGLTLSLTGCGDTPAPKKEGDKMGKDKMEGDKMGKEKMGKDK
jgi:pentapeptide MXKDX repeat protein